MDELVGWRRADPIDGREFLSACCLVLFVVLGGKIPLPTFLLVTHEIQKIREWDAAPLKIGAESTRVFIKWLNFDRGVASGCLKVPQAALRCNL